MLHEARTATPQRGFTLIELMIVIAVAALLLAVAVPSYLDTTRKGRRAEAVAALTQLQQAQERHRANNPQYATTFAAFAPPLPASATEHYNLVIDAANASAYTITANAKPGSPQSGDQRCRGLRIRAASGALNYESVNAASAVDTTNANRCWAR